MFHLKPAVSETHQLLILTAFALVITCEGGRPSDIDLEFLCTHVQTLKHKLGLFVETHDHYLYRRKLIKCSFDCVR